MKPDPYLWHRRIGMVAALPLLFIALSGSLLALQPVLRSPPRIEVASPAPARSAAQWWEVANRVTEQAGAELQALHPPRQADEPFSIHVASDAGPKRLWFHPVTLNPIEIAPERGEEIWRTLYSLHRGAVAGQVGEVIASICGILLGVLAVLGVLQRRRVRLARPGIRPTRHSLVGVWAALPLGVLGILGAVLNYQGTLGRFFDPVPAAGAMPSDAHQLLETSESSARAAVPAVRLEGVYFPRKPGAPLLYYFENGSRVLIDPANAAVLKVRTPTTHWITALYPLHSGRVLGPWGPLVVLPFGLLIPYFAWTGLRRRYRRTALSSRSSIYGAPPMVLELE